MGSDSISSQGTRFDGILCLIKIDKLAHLDISSFYLLCVKEYKDENKDNIFQNILPKKSQTMIFQE